MSYASITVRRYLEWIDTDAAGIWHYTAALRHIEYAEFELHRSLGIHEQTFGRIPRVKVALEFRGPVRFADEVATTVTVAAIGRSSMRYATTLRGPEGVVAEGEVTSVLVETIGGRSVPLPDDLRALLTGTAVG